MVQLTSQPELLEKLARGSFLVNVRGYGCALREGIKESRGDYIIMGDGDNTYDFSQIGEFVRLLREGTDLVIGNRFWGKMDSKIMPWHHRWIGTPLLTWHLNLFFKTRISDMNCGLRGFKKKAIENLDLKCQGMEFASEMIVRTAQKRLSIQEIPIHYYPPSPNRTSHLHSFRDGWRHLRLMLVFCPKYLFLFPGLVLFLVGLVLTALLHVQTVYILGMPAGLSTGTLAGALLITGMQIALFGVYSIILMGSRGYGEKDDKIERFFKKNFTLEKGLTIGGVFFILGILMFGFAGILIFKFANRLPYVEIRLARLAIASVFITLLGLQIIFSSFLCESFSSNGNAEIKTMSQIDSPPIPFRRISLYSLRFF